ncbi:MAG: DUF2459 domain-containing protein [Steroidobacteraceae bacterium]
MRTATSSGIAVAFVLAILPACATHTRIALPAPPASFAHESNHYAIGVLDAGWHTGLIVPASALGPLAPLARHAPRTGYLIFGWGNRRFYTAAHPTLRDAIGALFESRSVVLVQIVPNAAALTGEGRVSWLCASRDALWRLDAYLSASLSRSDGALVAAGPGPEPGSRFFASGEHYDLLHMCNTWTLAGLEYAGLPVHASGALLASQVESRIRDLPHCRHARPADSAAVQ